MPGWWCCPAAATWRIWRTRPASPPRCGASCATCGRAEVDAPIFDPAAFRLTAQEAALTARAREFGQAVLAPRAARWDREASFPTDNYRDMHGNGLLGVCIP